MGKKSLQPAADGVIRINIGWKRTKNGKRSQAKISVGTNPKEAERRCPRIEQLWDEISKSESPFWDDFTLDIAKRLGNGALQIPIAQMPRIGA